MAVSANSVWEVRSTATASNANGGFFVTGASGTDFSQQDAAQYNLTGATSAGADAIILHASAAANMVGNGARVVSGTNAIAGWYQITAVEVGVSITVDRNWGTGAVANGVVNIGGALSLGSSDDAVFETLEAGNTMWIKNGTYTFGGTVSIAKAGGASSPIKIRGYASTRGDNPTGSTRPTLGIGTVIFTLGVNWEIYNCQLTGTGSSILTVGTSSKVSECKITNTSTTAGRVALTLLANGAMAIKCEVVSYRGVGINGQGQVFGCYVHDCDIGIQNSTTGNESDYINNIVESCVTYAVSFSDAHTAKSQLFGNTLFGSSNTTGVGVNFVTGCTNIRLVNNIIKGFVTGVVHADTQTIGYDNYNCYHGNDTNATNWTLGANSITTDPEFTSVGQVTGATATTSGGILTQAGADFASVTANQDFCYIVSGTGVTAGQYLITAKTGTTLTLSPAPSDDATADKVFQVTTGRNFAIEGSAIGTGFPGTFPAGLTIAYEDIGAVDARYGAGIAPELSGGSHGSKRFGGVRGF